MNTFGLHTFAIAPVWDLARIEPQMERLKEYGIGLLEIPLLRPSEIDTKRARAFASRYGIDLVPSLAGSAWLMSQPPTAFWGQHDFAPGILVLFTLALTWLAVIAGLSAPSVEGASAFSYPLIFLPFISSAFVPTDSMPGPVRWFAENQPVTSIVDAIRGLLTEQPVGNDVWVALAWCIGILVLAAASGKDGPGPMITEFAARSGISALPVLVTIIPGSMTDEQIVAVT